MKLADTGQPARHPLPELGDLPEGWAEATLDQLLEALDSGSRPKGGVRSISEGVPSIGGEHLDDRGGFRFEKIKYVPQGFYSHMARGRIHQGDILVVKDGATTGKVALVRHDFPYDPAVVNEHVFICRPLDDVYPPFLFYFLWSEEGQRRILENFRGSAQGGINQGFASGTSVPLAPAREQQRIVEKLQELLSRVNAGRDRLRRVPTILKRFRQAVLVAACSGRLTADWREEHPNTGPAIDLLEAINSLRRRRTARYVAVRPVELSREDLEGIPDRWVWVTFGEVVGELKNGISVRPDPSPPGNPILRINAVRPGQVLFDDVRFLPQSDHLVAEYRLGDGDLLFTRYNGSLELLGVCGMVRRLGEAALLYPDKLMRVRFDHGYILPQYAELFFQAPRSRDRLLSRAKSSAGQHGISGADVKAQALALPPLEEQHEIVRRVEALFRLADAIGKRVAAASTRAEKLTHAILAKAFRGELVPTEADLARREGRDYEPASVLLERIQREREVAAGDRRKRR